MVVVGVVVVGVVVVGVVVVGMVVVGVVVVGVPVGGWVRLFVFEYVGLCICGCSLTVVWKYSITMGSFCTLGPPHTAHTHTLHTYTHAHTHTRTHTVITPLLTSCAPKLVDCAAKDLYLMSKDDLKELIGLGSSARLYSQLQRDRAKVRYRTGSSDVISFSLNPIL